MKHANRIMRVDSVPVDDGNAGAMITHLELPDGESGQIVARFPLDTLEADAVEYLEDAGIPTEGRRCHTHGGDCCGRAHYYRVRWVRTTTNLVGTVAWALDV